MSCTATGPDSRTAWASGAAHVWSTRWGPLGPGCRGRRNPCSSTASSAARSAALASPIRSCATNETMSTTPRPIDSDADTLAVDAAFVIERLRGFIADGVRKVGFERAIVGLSGGVDSALVTALAVSSLGTDNIVAVFMPYRSSDPQSQIDAFAVCASLGISAKVVDITPQVDAYFERFPEADRTRRGNKMARERMSILYDHSMAERALVLGTSNKTELLLGYGTLFGDMASALNPIGDLYKTQVYSLARAVGLPERVLTKAPSADLWAGQSDEDELGMRYAVVDQGLHLLVDERRTRAEVIALGFDPTDVDSIVTRVRGSQYKRRPPVIAKLSNRTIDREFRYPRDWGR